MTKLQKTTAALALLGVLAVPVGWAVAPASAAPSSAPNTVQGDDQATDDAPDTTAPVGDRAGRRAERLAERRAERQRLVAEKLGVTPQELRDARIAVLEEQLAERLASGRITQERADEIVAAAKDGTLPELRRRLRAERLGGG